MTTDDQKDDEDPRDSVEPKATDDPKRDEAPKTASTPKDQMTDEELRAYIRAKKAKRKRSNSSGSSEGPCRRFIPYMEPGRIYPMLDIEVLMERHGGNSASAGPATTWASRQGYLEKPKGRGYYRVTPKGLAHFADAKAKLDGTPISGVTGDARSEPEVVRDAPAIDPLQPVADADPAATPEEPAGKLEEPSERPTP